VTANPIRFLQITPFYPAYLTDFYAARPHLARAPYATQIDALLDDGFSGSHMFTRALRTHGFETFHVVANNPHSQAAWMREHGHGGENVDAAAASLMQIETIAPDIVYTTDVVTLHSGFFRRLNRTPPVVAGWRGFPIPAGTNLSSYDLVLTSFDRIFDEARACGAKYVERFHPGFPEDSPILKEPRQIMRDVVFSGTVTRQHMRRIQVLNMLAEMSLDPAARFSFNLFMPDASALSPLAQSLNRGAVWADDMLRLLRSARIVVNVDVDSFGQPPNMRLIEATGAGAFLLTTHHPEIASFFEPGEEIETFRTPQELAAKILYYLGEPARADEIARRGQERCLRDHALSKRAAWFADIMRGALDRARALPSRLG
jgi:spore maturation protein CgeB